ncbi:MAG: hypothetical protein ACYDHH_12160 [Solirubrobacteraceae bacterium]
MSVDVDEALQARSIYPRAWPRLTDRPSDVRILPAAAYSEAMDNRASRRRRQVGRLTLLLLRPVFRYSVTRDAHVLRLIGARRGPVLQEKIGEPVTTPSQPSDSGRPPAGHQHRPGGSLPNDE